ncbi:hypothetical protein [Shinella sp.]|uniref:hypothetical protein n=1 Tax=Shinella sp. TaxID=1870904 RepID=UPI003F7081FC
MLDFSIVRSFGLMARTLPFLLLRVVVYFGIICALVLTTGAGAGIGWGMAGIGDQAARAGSAFWGGTIGFGVTAAVLFFLREYILYIVKAGHIAVMVELLDGESLPDSKGQIAHAKEVVTERFLQASILFAIDQLVKGVLGAITGLIQGVASFLPIPGVRQIMGLVRAFLRVSIGLVDEVILAHAIRTRSDNPWDSARTALVLYGQNARPMMRNAAFLTILVYGLSLIIFLLMLTPAAALVYAMPGAWSAGGIVFALLFAWGIKAALIEPFAIACMLQAFFKLTDNQTPDPTWDTKLSQISRKFNRIKEKSGLWTPVVAVTAPLPEALAHQNTE